jgi:hypothetical protein
MKKLWVKRQKLCWVLGIRYKVLAHPPPFRSRRRKRIESPGGGKGWELIPNT